ncbi:DUF4178 domain-containing protein [Saezia sanguinis]|uniref:DUF4178 domain-containing protein n=1 Tax=Saezia sanguinis TaxID=1965230 RepID=UPI0030494B26
MALNAVFSLSCPSCGATVPVYSATSALVVCEYCHSTLIRSGDGAVDSGKKSALIENFSPLQLYTSGTFQGKAFTIIGQLQIQYNRGFWNEWYVLYDDSSYGWLADFSGQYVMTRIAKPLNKPPAFKDIVAGVTQVQYAQYSFVASDVRNATSVKANARGELPFVLKEDELVLGADFRHRQLFMTLDYSQDPKTPLVYHGKAVTLENLRCQNLRSNEQIQETAGKLRGQRTAFKCPSCGASLDWYPGVAQNIICPSCHSDINLDENKAQVMQTYEMRQAQIAQAPLKLGEVAQINGVQWTLIGMTKIQELLPDETLEYIQGRRKHVPIESADWMEYLLYHPQKGFLWLVQSEGKWDISHAPDSWPEFNERLEPLSAGKRLTKLYNYGGEVAYAAGAFYWHIQPGDITYYQDYRYDKGKLCAERTREELNWSVSRPVSAAELAKWFGRPDLEQVALARGAGASGGHITSVMMIIFIVLNIPAFMRSLSSGGLIGVIMVTVVVYLLLGSPFSEAEDD